MRPPWIAIGLISAAALSYEILLLALFSYIQWHHFAYLVVSIALLGFGASGSLLVLLRRRLENRYRPFALSQACLFALSAPLCFVLTQRLAFNPEELIWDPVHWIRLALAILLLMLPFMFAANLLGLSLFVYRRQLARIYAADLIGAGIGACLAIGMLFWKTPTDALGLIALLGLAAAVMVWLEGKVKPLASSATLGALGLISLCLPSGWIAPQVSPYKELSQVLRVSGSQIVAERSSPLGVLTVVESPRVPLRHAPGLSLLARQVPPAQLGMFTNAGAMSAITRFRGNPAELSYLDDITSALAYHMHAPQRVLVIGAGGGAEVLQAIYHDTPQIDAVEINPQVIALLRGDLADFSGNLYRHPRVSVFNAEAREFLQLSPGGYDFILLPPLDSSASAGTGLHGLSENYLYTIEALQLALTRVSDNGLVSLTRWLRLPPRDALKLFATAIAALENLGVEHPEHHLLLIRGLQTTTLLIGKSELATEQIDRAKNFSARRAFDTAYYPGMPATEANRYNQLEVAYFYQGARQLLGAARGQFLSDYKFNLEPATDDRPFHFHFAKWRSLPELIGLRHRGGGALIETGYLTLLVALALAFCLSLLLILVPLAKLSNQTEPATGKIRPLIYFCALGFAFLLIEIAILQKFILLLNHPVYTAAIVLTSFLLAAGAGAAYAQRQSAAPGRAAIYALGSILLIGLCLLAMLDDLLPIASAWPFMSRILLCVGLIAPLGFCMGMPFPLGLSAIREDARALLPWAWGINGCTSVISAVLASLLAIHFGFNAVILVGLSAYAVAAISFPAAIVTSR